MTQPEGKRPRKLPCCPISGRPRDAMYRPFCSARCRDVDLGRWFKQVYSIPAEEPDERDAAESVPDNRSDGDQSHE